MAVPVSPAPSELMFLETSALTGENVEEAFVQCARKILNKIESGTSRRAPGQRGATERGWPPVRHPRLRVCGAGSGDLLGQGPEPLGGGEAAPPPARQLSRPTWGVDQGSWHRALPGVVMLGISLPA